MLPRNPVSLGLTAFYISAMSSAKILYAGVNSAGGEFAQQNLPGMFGTDYQFINQSAIDFFIDAGVNTIRLPFLVRSTFNESYFSEYQTAVNYITMRGGYVVVDPHNYYRYNDPSSQPSSGSIIG
ncbi:glycoside hydrolase family 5 protein, partial [Karstenula rhodostoma CBS 690.94]